MSGENPERPLSWTTFLCGGLVCLVLFYAVSWLWERDENHEKEVAEEAPTADGEQTEESEVTAEETTAPTPAPTPEPTPESTPVAESTPEPTRATATPEPTPEPTPSPTPVPDPTGCTFVDGNRPMVGDKYVLRCDNGALFLAHGEYVGGGVFNFHDFEPHAP